MELSLYFSANPLAGHRCSFLCFLSLPLSCSPSWMPWLHAGGFLPVLWKMRLWLCPLFYDKFSIFWKCPAWILWVRKEGIQVQVAGFQTFLSFLPSQPQGRSSTALRTQCDIWVHDIVLSCNELHENPTLNTAECCGGLSDLSSKCVACFYVSLCVFIPKATPTPNTQMEHLEERSSVTSQAEDRHCSICPPPLCSPCRSWKSLTGMFPPTLHSDLSSLWQSFLFGSVQCWFHCCSDERITVWWLKHYLFASTVPLWPAQKIWAR